MIDTGASGICIDRRVALALGLIGSNRKPLQMADGSETVATSYRAFMSVKGLNCEDWVEVCGVPMKLPSSRVLLGRSFLRRYIVTYNGPEELFHYYDAEQRRNNSHFEHDE